MTTDQTCHWTGEQRAQGEYRTTADMARELTQRHKHTETYAYDSGGTTYTTIHVTEHASLLDQLQRATLLLGNADDGIRLGYGSKPSARIDAIDALTRINDQARGWANRATLNDSVRAAAALAPSLQRCGHHCRDTDCDRTCCPRHHLEHDIHRWWTWARLTTGWDRPAWRPDATCPQCGERGTLRIHLDHDDRHGMCTNCHHTWDEQTIGRLAKHIEAENECTHPGCGDRARHDGRCKKHRNLTIVPERVTLHGLGEVSPAEARILVGVIDKTQCVERGQHERRTPNSPCQRCGR
jgi:hypothetical protein